MTPTVVAAAVVERDGRVLVTRRHASAHLGGLWEFPGGKRHAGETLDACMKRELLEELGVDAEVEEELLVTSFDYPEKRVELHFLRCRLLGEPLPQLGQEMRWVTKEELRRLELPPADEELVRLLTSQTAGPSR